MCSVFLSGGFYSGVDFVVFVEIGATPSYLTKYRQYDERYAKAAVMAASPSILREARKNCHNDIRLRTVSLAQY